MWCKFQDSLLLLKVKHRNLPTLTTEKQGNSAPPNAQYGGARLAVATTYSDRGDYRYDEKYEAYFSVDLGSGSSITLQTFTKLIKILFGLLHILNQLKILLLRIN